jgi:hypothetical protein
LISHLQGISRAVINCKGATNAAVPCCLALLLLVSGVDGGVSGPASWQYNRPLNAKIWQKMQPGLPRDTRETHGGTARRLAGALM